MRKNDKLMIVLAVFLIFIIFVIYFYGNNKIMNTKVEPVLNNFDQERLNEIKIYTDKTLENLDPTFCDNLGKDDAEECWKKYNEVMDNIKIIYEKAIKNSNVEICDQLSNSQKNFCLEKFYLDKAKKLNNIEVCNFLKQEDNKSICKIAVASKKVIDSGAKNGKECEKLLIIKKEDRDGKIVEINDYKDVMACKMAVRSKIKLKK